MLRWLHLVALLAGLPVATGCWASESAMADEVAPPEKVLDLNLPAQELAHSLSALGGAVGQNIVYLNGLAFEADAPAIKGQLTFSAALRQLLPPSLTWYRIDDQTIAIGSLQEGQNHSIYLDPLDIRTHKPGDYQPDFALGITHSSKPWLEQAQAISQVTNSVLSDQKPRNLDDALRNVAGFTQGNTMGSTQDTLMKRGFGDNRDGSILRDGMTAIQGRSFNATTDHIEVLKGPSTLLYGIQDPGGMVNIVSKTPQLAPSSEVLVSASGYVKNRNGGRTTIDTTGPIGDSNVAFRLILDHQDETYWRNFGTHRETLVAPSLAWYGEDNDLTLAFENRDFVTPFDRGTAISPSTNRPLNIPYDRRLDEPFNDMRGRSQLLRLTYNSRLDDRWSLRSSIGYNQERYDAYQVRVVAIDPVKNSLSRSLDGTLGSDSHDLQSFLELSGEASLAGLNHDFLVGIVDEHRLYFRSDMLRQKSPLNFNYAAPIYGLDSKPTTVSNSDSDQSDRLRTHALYVRDAIDLTDSVIATFGGRFLVYDQYAGRGRPFRANTDIKGSAFIPSASILYRLAPEWSWYLSYSESVKPSSSIAPLNASSVQIIDSTIKPERAKAWETGLKYELQNGLTSSIAFYEIRKDDVLVSETIDDLPVSRNAGSVRSKGVEFEAMGRLSEAWDAIATYAYTDARVTRDPTLAGNRLQNVPKVSASLYLTHDFAGLPAGQELKIGGGPRYVGARPGDPANTFSLPSYTVTDAFIRYGTAIGDRPVSLQLNVNNLFNRQYYPSSVSRNLVSVGDPRQFLLSITLKL